LFNFIKCICIWFAASATLIDSFANAGTMSDANQTRENLFPSWYIGASAGGVWGKLKNTLSVKNDPSSSYFVPKAIPGVNDSGSASFDSDKFSGALQIGYEKFIKNNLFFGLELSYQYINLQKSTGGTFYYQTIELPYQLNNSASAKQMFALRPRIGYLFDKFLPYITAGGALTKLRFNQMFSEPPYTTLPVTAEYYKTKYGWTVGFGSEYALFKNFYLKSEYLYTNFGSATAFGYLQTPFGNANFNNSLGHLSVQTLLLGVNFHFA